MRNFRSKNSEKKDGMFVCCFALNSHFIESEGPIQWIIRCFALTNRNAGGK